MSPFANGCLVSPSFPHWAFIDVSGCQPLNDSLFGSPAKGAYEPLVSAESAARASQIRQYATFDRKERTKIMGGSLAASSSIFEVVEL